MAIELNVNGYFDLIIFDNENVEVSKKEEKVVLDKLQKYDYVIGMGTRTIFSLEDFETVLYTFELVPTDGMEYEFDEL